MHTYADDRGRSLMSLFDHVTELPGQFNASVMFVGAVKAWHRHRLQDDHWVVLSGAVKVGLFNSESTELTAELRLATPAPDHEVQRTLKVAPGAGLSVALSAHVPGVLRIPAGLWHGGVAVGDREALLLYYVTRKYDARNPDEERAAWDAFPFRWDIERR